ncbi:MAG: glycosyl hydrolase family 18 protein [Candidatus Oleimicrobiaceae bacterium]
MHFLRANVLKRGLILVCLGALLPVAGASDYLIVGYYPSWVHYSFPPWAIDMANLSHVVHAFAWPNADGSLASYSDFDPAGFVAAVHTGGKKALLSLGGWGQSDGFSPVASDPSRRARFMGTVTAMCQSYDYDGVDVDWEYPMPSERGNLTALIRELRQSLAGLNPPRLLTMAVPAGSWAGARYDFVALAPELDWLGCMTYDFHGSWTSHAGHNAPLYASGGDQCGSVHEAVTYLLSLGLPREKILVGVPFYGRQFNASRLYGPSTGGAEVWYSLAAAYLHAGWTYQWDDVAKVPFLINPSRTLLLSFDDTTSVGFKCAYVSTKGLGGVMVWALGQDQVGGRQVLLSTVGRALLGPSAVTDLAEGQVHTKLRVYPNPCNGWVAVAYTLRQPGPVQVRLFDMRGRLAWQADLAEQTAGDHRLLADLRGLASGLYMCQLQTPSGVATSKVIIMR